ncbi:unnamed protein product [Clonostachys rosea f. rosea IK726]|uniref:Uncharacterized protein n=1 Tax=Clonostachys rosea f. rosea IK726 TaxID=1349383 RepID=A0ACA9UMN0_BIOOC|nr:unnamed protein product [Clonostachys rosea f. rosea IK726]
MSILKSRPQLFASLEFLTVLMPTLAPVSTTPYQKVTAILSWLLQAIEFIGSCYGIEETLYGRISRDDEAEIVKQHFDDYILTT